MPSRLGIDLLELDLMGGYRITSFVLEELVQITAGIVLLTYEDEES